MKHLGWVHGISQLAISVHRTTDEPYDGRYLKQLEHFTTLKHLRLEVSPMFFPWVRGDVTRSLWVESDYRQCWNTWRVPPGCKVTVLPVNSPRADREPYRWTQQGYLDCSTDCVTQVFASNVAMYERLLSVHLEQGVLEVEDLPERWEEVENLCAINRKVVMDLFREMKREKLAAKGSSC